jgi:hypothetical protein
MIMIHQESEGGAVCPTTKAVIEAFRRTDCERRRLLVMKRATCFEFPTGFFQLNAAPQDFNDVGSRYQVVYEMLGYQSAHRSHLTTIARSPH